MYKALLIFCFYLICSFISASGQKPDSASISGSVDFLKEGDTVTLMFYHFTPKFTVPGDSEYYCRIHDGTFFFKFPVLKAQQYMDIIFNRFDPQKASPTKNLVYNFFKKGENINVSLIGNSVVFTGKGSERFNAKRVIDHIRHFFYEKVKDGPPVEMVHSAFKISDRNVDSCVQYLKNEKVLSTEDRDNLIADEIIGGEYFKLSRLRFFYNDEFRRSLRLKYDIRDSTFDGWTYLSAYFKKLDISKYGKRPLFADYIFYCSQIRSTVLQQRAIDLEKEYDRVVKHYPKGLSENVVLRLIYYHSYVTTYENNPIVVQTISKKAANYVQDNRIKELLLQFQTKYLVGKPAFNFSLKDSSGRNFRLSDFSGKVVLIDFWYTGCGNCVRLIPFMEMIESRFLGKGVVYVSVSIDSEKSLWINSLKSRKYTTSYSINLLSTGDNTIDPLIKYYEITAYPRLILIDSEGNLCAAPVDPRYDNGKNLIELINKALEKRKGPGI